MKKYIRLGEIPKNERSIDYTKLTWSQRDDLTNYEDDLWSEVENHIKWCNSWKNLNIEEIFEIGVSVFEMDDKGDPILNNEHLEESWSWRKEKVVLVVTGDVVGRGHDGEPLLKNVEILERR